MPSIPASLSPRCFCRTAPGAANVEYYPQRSRQVFCKRRWHTLKYCMIKIIFDM